MRLPPPSVTTATAASSQYRRPSPTQNGGTAAAAGAGAGAGAAAGGGSSMFPRTNPGGNGSASVAAHSVATTPTSPSVLRGSGQGRGSGRGKKATDSSVSAATAPASPSANSSTFHSARSLMLRRIQQNATAPSTPTRQRRGSFSGGGSSSMTEMEAEAVVVSGGPPSTPGESAVEKRNASTPDAVISPTTTRTHHARGQGQGPASAVNSLSSPTRKSSAPTATTNVAAAAGDRDTLEERMKFVEMRNANLQLQRQLQAVQKEKDHIANQVQQLNHQRQEALDNTVERVERYYASLLNGTADDNTEEMSKTARKALQHGEGGSNHSDASDADADADAAEVLAKMQEQYIAHRRRIEELEDQLHQSKKQQQQQHLQLQQRANGSTKTAKAVGELQRRVQQLERENADQRTCYFSEVNRLKEQLSKADHNTRTAARDDAGARQEGDTSEQMTQLQAEIAHLRHQLQEKESTIATMESDSVQTESDVNMLKSLIEEQTAENDGLKRAVEKKDEAIHNLETAMDELKRKTEQDQQDAKRNHNPEVNVLRNVAAEQAEELQQIKGHLKDKETRIQSLQEKEVRTAVDLQMLKNVATEQAEELKRIRSDAEATKHAAMSRAVDTDTAEKAEAEAERARLKEEKEQMESTLKQMTVTIDERDATITQLTSDVEERDSAIAHLTSTVRTLTTEAQRQEAHAKELEQQLRSTEESARTNPPVVTEELELSRGLVVEQAKEMDDMKTQLSQQTDRVALLVTEVEETKAELSQSNSMVVQLEKEMEDTKKQLSDKCSDVDQLEKQVDESRTQLSERDDRISQLERDVEEHREATASASAVAAEVAGRDYGVDEAEYREVELKLETTEAELSALQQEKMDQHDKLTSIVVTLEKEKHEHQEHVKSLQSEVHRLKMKVKDEAYAAGVEIVKILAAEEGRESLQVNELEKKFLQVNAEDKASQPQVPPSSVEVPESAKNSDGSTVTLDAVYVARLKQQLVQSKIGVARMEKQIAFVKGICDQIVESLRGELADIEAERADFEKDMLTQLSKLNGDKIGLEEEYSSKLHVKEAKIASLEKRIQELSSSPSKSRGGLMRRGSSPMLGLGHKKVHSDTDSESLSSSQHLPPTAPESVAASERQGPPQPPPQSPGASTADVVALQAAVTTLQKEKEELQGMFEEKLRAVESDRASLEGELGEQLREKEEKILDLYDKLGELAQRSGAGAPRDDEPHSLAVDAIYEERERELREQVNEGEVKIKELRETAMEQKQVIDTLTADLRTLQESSEKAFAVCGRRQENSLDDGEAEEGYGCGPDGAARSSREMSLQDHLVSKLEHVSLMHGQATASMEEIHDMIRELRNRRDLSDDHHGQVNLELNDAREVAISILYKSKEVRQNLKVSLQLLESRLMNRLETLDEELERERLMGVKDVAAAVDSRTLQIRDEARISLVEIEKEFLDKLSSLEVELKRGEDIISALECRCEEQDKTLSQLRGMKRRKKGTSLASRQLIERLEQEVTSAAQLMKKKEEKIGALAEDLEKVRANVDEEVEKGTKKKDAMITKLEGDLADMKKKVKTLEYDFSFSDSDSSDKEEDAKPEEALSPAQKSSPFLQKVAESYTGPAVQSNEYLGYC